MANPLVDAGTGASLVFSTTSWTAEIVDIKRNNQKRAALDTTHLGTIGGMTSMPGDLYDPGELEIKFHFNPDSPPPITSTAEVVQIKYPLSGTITTGSNDKINAFVTEIGSTIPLEQVMEGTLKLKLSGTFTHSAAA